MRTFALAALTLALGACATTSAPRPGARYVAMGSSYAAGTALGGIKPGTPERCARSPVNYANLVAARLRLALVDQSCGGATTANVLNAWNELPAQIDALTPDTRLVTITIGGNDLGYIMNLVAGSCDPAKGVTYGGRTMPCPSLREPTREDYAKVEGALRAIAREVARRAPKARLIFVQYVRLIPDAPCEGLRMSAQGALANRALGERLAAATRRAAEAEGAEVLAVDELSRDHTPCAAAPWSTGPVPLGPDANAPWHPNRSGHAAIAVALERLVTGR